LFDTPGQCRTAPFHGAETESTGQGNLV
jgi:hypothetical protein